MSDELRTLLHELDNSYTSEEGSNLIDKIMGLFDAQNAELVATRRDAELSKMLIDSAMEVEIELRTKLIEAQNTIACLEYAAQMPDEYEFGLPSWIYQRLYASYIGAYFSQEVLEGIKFGRLSFPESPAEVERVKLRAELSEMTTERNIFKEQLSEALAQIKEAKEFFRPLLDDGYYKTQSEEK
jgi:hypothetical protein